VINDRIQRIVWICHSPSPYNDHLFETLSRDLLVPFEFYFTTRAAASAEWNHSAAIRNWYAPKAGIDWNVLAKACSPSTFFVTNCWQDRTSELAILWRALAGLPYLMWNDTPDPSRRRGLALRFARSTFLTFAFRNARAVMGTGQTALAALSSMGCPDHLLVDFPNFVDVDHFTCGSAESRNPLVFGSCGRLDPVKGYDIALHALASLDTPFRYVIAGEGAERRRLETLARDLGIADRVIFRGWVSYKDAPAFYRSLDVFLHPARREAFGAVIAEAMACGLPVIASDRTAAALDRVEPYINGFLHRSEDPSALLEVLKKFVSIDPARRLGMREAARAVALQWPSRRAVEIIAHLIDSPTKDVAVHAG
jgi:glycosyltransferase involved in cell wall biosynthesis